MIDAAALQMMFESALDPIAAGAISVGVIVLATSEWAARRLPAWIPTAFVTSFACGALGLFLPRLDALFIASGMLFGVTFSAMALFMLRSSPT